MKASEAMSDGKSYNEQESLMSEADGEKRGCYSARSYL